MEEKKLKTLHYVPGELCVLTSVSSEASALDTPEDQESHYEEVRNWLNQQLPAHLSTTAAGEVGEIELDLAPSRLAPKLARAQHVLVRLQRGEETATGTTPEPWVVLRGRQGARHRVLHFYTIAELPPDDVADISDPHELCVRDVANTINRRLRQAVTPANRKAWCVHAATPNWLSVGAQDDGTTGGPASRPAPAPQGNWGFWFDDPALNDLVQTGAGEGVVVAVLDTSPASADVVRQKADDLAAAGKPNWLLSNVASTVSIAEPPSCQPAELQHLQHVVPNCGPAVRPDHEYFMPDHGLISCGVIRNVARNAEIHLIRVLTDNGVGDMLRLVKTLAALPECFLSDGKKKLVVNLSLMVDVPTEEEHLRFWLPKTYENPRVLRQRWGEVSRNLRMTHSTLEETIAWLNEMGVLVIAAAGNDGFSSATRPEPRLPARYDDVFGVAAVCRDSCDQPAAFSNRGDVVVMGNGVAVFGGNAHEAADGGPPVIDTNVPDVDAVVGVFSSDQLPFGGGPNETGWVYWSGTSFATPVISGIAAALWSKPANAGLSPIELIHTLIREFSQAGQNTLDCPAIAGYQRRLPAPPF